MKIIAEIFRWIGFPLRLPLAIAFCVFIIVLTAFLLPFVTEREEEYLDTVKILRASKRWVWGLPPEKNEWAR